MTRVAFAANVDKDRAETSCVCETLMPPKAIFFEKCDLHNLTLTDDLGTSRCVGDIPSY